MTGGPFRRTDRRQRERAEEQLAPAAVRSADTRGRAHPEPEDPLRTAFERDRDRILHAKAFRRLKHKTQVFIHHEGDHFRTRLTHTLEVAQIARSIARPLGLDEDLVEAISLAHDLGHTPFGHAGQDALHQCMKPHGGFEHNLQSLRVVDLLEQRYAAFDGLNLCFETREGILKHCSLKNARLLGDVGARFVQRRRPSAEAQLANLADEIAYNNHDVDDGLRSGLLNVGELAQVDLFARHMKQVSREYPKIDARRLVHETVRRMISALVVDLTRQTAKNIKNRAPRDIADVRSAQPLVAFSAAMRRQQLDLKQFLRLNLYQHYQVARMTNKARRIVTDLFEAFSADLRLLPPQYQARTKADPARAVADYIAGMTDRYAIREHRKLFAVDEIQLSS